MKQKKFIVFTLLYLLATFIWISPVLAVDAPETKPDKGLVVFYRLNSFKGGAIRFNINHAEGSIGQLLNGTMLYRYLVPGAHTFTSQAVSGDSITLEVEAGKAYFVKGDVRMGVYAGRPKFTLMSESEGKDDLNKLK